MTTALTLSQAEARIKALMQREARTIIGLVGPPGAGKSTLTARLCAHAGDGACIVPMDGFHLANSELLRLGRRERKGAPDTFDADGYVALLTRLRVQREGETVYAPEFRREMEEPIAGAIPIPAHVRLLLAEGNYLAHDQGGWQRVAPLLDEIWYVQVDEALRLQRLTERHIRFGRTPEAARAWVLSTDEPNARLIEATKPRAQFVVMV